MRHLTGQADYCRRQAKRCQHEAGKINDPIVRGYMLRLAARWADLAEKYELAENVSGLLQWNAQRLEAPSTFDRNA